MSPARIALAAFVAFVLCATAPAADAATRGTLEPFASESAFLDYLAALKAEAEKTGYMPAMIGPPLPPPAAPPPTSVAPTSTPAPSEPAAADTITNVQTAGVDEGDIVKKHGDFLVVLRRGRLFTLDIGDGGLEVVDTANAYAPGVDPDRTWYDEMLVGDGVIAVVGFSYARGGTEVGLFDLGDDGRIAYRDTYQLRGNDYYSARNYASRLIGDQLVFYTPLYIDPYALQPVDFMPALRRWHPAATPEDFHRILPATRIYRSTGELDLDDLALHTVSRCDLSATPMRCESTAVLGPDGRVFYVSEDAVYVWTAPWNPRGPDASSVYRIPLDGGAPTGLRTSGSPIDQMSFLQRDGYLNVLVGSQAAGDAMWDVMGDAGRLALLRVPLDSFGDGHDAAPRDAYRPLPHGSGDAYNLHNRYIGDWLVYGGAWRGYVQDQTAHAIRYADEGARASTMRLGHGLQRVDAMGGDAILVGPRGPDLLFTSVRLDRGAHPARVFVQRNATQGDARTHGFFYKREDADTGIVGLPILGYGMGRESAAVLYLRNRALDLSRLGTLDSAADAHVDDHCRASCVDWYGNARPIFIGDRVFALLGYEMVEGRVDAGGAGERIVERRRVDFTPRLKAK